MVQPPVPFSVGAPVYAAFDPAQFEGVVARRAMAYIVDVLILIGIAVLYHLASGIVGILSFGLLYGPLLALAAFVPIAYHTFTIGSPAAATIGMRMFGLEVRVWHGGRPGYLQALLHTVVFYFSIGITGGLILVVPLFHNRSRCLHDILCGTLVVRRQP